MLMQNQICSQQSKQILAFKEELTSQFLFLEIMFQPGQQIVCKILVVVNYFHVTKL